MTTPGSDPTASPHRDSNFVSTLTEGHQRFLAYAVEHGFACGRRKAEDFIRHFPPGAIMKGLEHQAELRASILVLTTGLKHKIAIKKGWEDAGADLQIALEEGETDAESIVDLVGPDDRIRYLDPRKIWAFLTEGEFWKPSLSNMAEGEIARTHLAFLLTRALEDKLLTHRDVVEGATVVELANRLPKADLGRLVQSALWNAQQGAPFTEVDLLATTPPSVLVQHVPLSHLWETVVVPKVAERHGYVAARESAVTAEAPKAQASNVAAAPVPPKDAASLKPQIAKPKETPVAAAAPREPAKVRPKLPSMPEVPAPPPRAPSTPENVLTVHKAEAAFFGDESDDIEVIEDDVKAG